MKLTKKAAALLLAASLAVSMCATPAFALTNSNGGSGDGTTATAPTATEVTYNVTAGYTWSIPKDIKFGKDAGTGATRIVNATANEDTASTDATDTAGTAPKVCVTKNVIDVDKKLTISIDTASTTTTTYEEGVGKGFYVESKGEKLYFKIQKNDTLKTELTKTNNVVMSVDSGTNTGNQELVFTLTTTSKTAEQAGTYTGHVAFTASIDDKT
jgi:uncharacterized protein YraI